MDRSHAKSLQRSIEVQRFYTPSFRRIIEYTIYTLYILYRKRAGFSVNEYLKLCSISRIGQSFMYIYLSFHPKHAVVWLEFVDSINEEGIIELCS